MVLTLRPESTKICAEHIRSEGIGLPESDRQSVPNERVSFKCRGFYCAERKRCDPLVRFMHLARRLTALAAAKFDGRHWMARRFTIEDEEARALLNYTGARFPR